MTKVKVIFWGLVVLELLTDLASSYQEKRTGEKSERDIIFTICRKVDFAGMMLALICYQML